MAAHTVGCVRLRTDRGDAAPYVVRRTSRDRDTGQLRVARPPHPAVVPRANRFRRVTLPVAADHLGPSLSGAPAMLHYAVVFLVIALIAGALGFGGIAGSAVGIAKILFAVFIVLFLASMLLGR